MLKYYIGDLVYGANDGIVSTFAIVAGIAGAGLEPNIIVIIGLASLFADGFSMATSNYLASKSENFVLKNEEGSDDPHLKITSPIKSAFATFLAFIVAGSVPLLPYLILGNGNTFRLAAASTLIALFVVGSVRTLATGRSAIVGGVEMVVIGGVAATIAYLIGQFISSIV